MLRSNIRKLPKKQRGEYIKEEAPLIIDRFIFHRRNKLPFRLQKKAAAKNLQRPFSGGRGIRTPDTLLTYTRFPGVPLQPLEHHSLGSIP